MKELPIGIHDFAMIRREGLLYVDKTAQLLQLIDSGRRYFLARPRRFGKSLTLSTLEAMLGGRAELFEDLAAEDWVKKQAENPSPTVCLDMSGFDKPKTGAELNQALLAELEDTAKEKGLDIMPSPYCGKTLKSLIRELYKKSGCVSVLIDEYDGPILDSIDNLQRAEEMREVLRSFYTVLKSCDKYLRFVFITGISKFSKVGVFSAMNNLDDISMDEQYGDITGYTQNELEAYFSDRIDAMADRLQTNRADILLRLKDYYDGFSFDGKHTLYNPFSVMQCLKKAEFGNYWYESGSPSFIVKWMKDHDIKEPEKYRHIQVRSDFTGSKEIENADPASFLYQSGYLTVEKKEERLFTLDYPNREVLDSLSGMYLELIYHVEQFASLGTKIWHALENADLTETAKLFNAAAAEIPYEDFPNRNEFWYRSLFLMLLRGAGITAFAEVHTYKGRSDTVISFNNQIIVLEFKFAAKTSDVEKKNTEGRRQLREMGYADSYKADNRRVITAVLVADDEKRQISVCPGD